MHCSSRLHHRRAPDRPDRLREHGHHDGVEHRTGEQRSHPLLTRSRRARTPTTTLAATSTTSLTTVAVNSAKPSTTTTTAATTASTAAASKTDFSAVLALVDSAEQSGAGADKELNTANNAMNSTEQDPQS